LLFVSPVVLSRAHADEARFVALQLPLARWVWPSDIIPVKHKVT
jgi:hypothetical protein